MRSGISQKAATGQEKSAISLIKYDATLPTFSEGTMGTIELIFTIKPIQI